MHTYSEFLTDEQICEVAAGHVVSSGMTTYARTTEKVLQDSQLLERLSSSAKDDWERQFKLRLDFLISNSEITEVFDDTEFSVLYLALFKIKSPFLEEINQKLACLNFRSRELTWMKAMICWLEKGN